MEMENFKILEEFEEVVELDPSKVFIFWKRSLILLYSVCTVTSYAVAGLFRILWRDFCQNHCLMWARVHADKKLALAYWTANETSNRTGTKSSWSADPMIFKVTHNYGHPKFDQYCDLFLFSGLLSCATSIILLYFVATCGKRRYFAPWIIILPGLLISAVMTIVSMFALRNLNYGYLFFADSFYRLARSITKVQRNPYFFNQPCSALRTFVEGSYRGTFDVCIMYRMIQISTSLMLCFWISSSLILILRMLFAADFILMKIRVYEVPKTKRHSIVKEVYKKKRQSSYR
ncbi:hypothetical protein TKK_0012017 [Trichogramma kaykai]